MDSNKFPLKEESNTDKPLSFYAATKNQMKLWLIPILIFIEYHVLL